MAAAAFGGRHPHAPAVQVELLGSAKATATAAAIATETAQPPGSTSDDTPAPPATITGFAWPIVGGCLPQGDNLMPGAPREYRNGTHEGVDFYDSDNCTPIDVGTDVLAAKAGTVTRADWNYVDITAEQSAELESQARFNGNSPAIEDAFRGRQVWIDHGDGTLTRYAHLSGIAQGIDAGAHVDAGQLIAYVGESGTPESTSAPGTEYHLHFEIRAGEGYLGEGLPPEEVRRLYELAFSP